MRKFSVTVTSIVLMCLLLIGCRSGFQALQISQIPWSTDELVSYAIKLPDGTVVGSATVSISEEEETYIFTCEQRVGQSIDNYVLQVSSTTLEPFSENRMLFVPEGAGSSSGIWTIKADYKENKVTVQAQTPSGFKGPYEVSVPKHSYAGDELIFFLFRTLPFSYGYVANFNFVKVWPTVEPLRATLSVVGSELVNTGHGQVRAWKVESNVNRTKQYMWYETEAPNRLIKYDNGNLVFIIDL